MHEILYVEHSNLIFVKKIHHFILLGVTLVLSVVCAVLMLHVRVNSDMTKYLPDDSQMKVGLEIVDTRFGGAQSRGADVKIMVSDADTVSMEFWSSWMDVMPNVDGVTYERSSDGHYVLFNLFVPKSVDQKKLGNEIRHAIEARGPNREVVVETSQDGATPPFYVMVVAALLILLVLVVMSPSWMEPVVFLLSVGIAVVLNIGTNALLPSVSITTNYIVAILQMVLSLDYSIVLLNRYRQEFAAGITDRTEAINRAIRKAMPSIVSSALTTVVGLLMLCFMRLKIGTDMGVVLAKGVVMSLLCTFTVLPSLLMLCHGAIERSKKRVFIFPTDPLGRFTTRYRYPLAALAIVLFCASFYGSRRTDIFFSNNGESTISRVFPRVNPFVVVYHTADEDMILPMADSLLQMPGVTSAISYPTLFLSQYTATEMCQHLTNLGQNMAGNREEQQLTDMLSPEYLSMVYYLHSGKAKYVRVPFPDLARFIHDYCLSNPMFASAISPEMREGMVALDQMMSAQNNSNEAARPKRRSKKKEDYEDSYVEPLPAVQYQLETVLPQPQTINGEPMQVKPVVPKCDPSPSKQTINLVSFTPRLYENRQDFMSRYLMQITDTAAIRRPLNIKEMSALIGSSASQTQMVFSMAKNQSKMTPLQYVHFLTDDLFNRKALQSFVKENQKRELRIRVRFMDEANADAELTVSNLTQMLRAYGMDDVDEAYVRSIAFPRAPEPELLADTDTLVQTSDTTPEPRLALLTPEIPAVLAVLPTPFVPTVAPQPQPEPKEEPSSPTKADPTDLFAEMVYSGREYTAAEMAHNFTLLGQNVDTATIELLYTYYGSVCLPDSSYTLNLEQLFNYVADTLIYMPKCADFLSDDMKAGLVGARQQLDEGMAQLRNAEYSLLVIITDLRDESPETFAFVDRLSSLCDRFLHSGSYRIGESVMYSEMKQGFSHEMTVVTIFTILAIFLIVAITFRSVVVPTILVMVVLTAVYINVVFSGIIQGQMLYLAYLIVQSILMGATIDYGILYTHYYRENRLSGNDTFASVQAAYKGSIHTIMTSGLIMVAAPGAMSLMVTDVTIRAILGALAIGALAAVLMILFVLPGLLVALDRWVVRLPKTK